MNCLVKSTKFVANLAYGNISFTLQIICYSCPCIDNYKRQHQQNAQYYYRGADKSLARPGRKQATAIRLARRLTCFLAASVTRKDLQFGTWTDPSFQRHYRFRPTT